MHSQNFMQFFQGKGAFLIWEFSTTSVTFEAVVAVNIKVMRHGTV